MKNLLLLFFSIVIGLLVAESVVRYFIPQVGLRGSWFVFSKHNGYWLNKNEGTNRHRLRTINVTYHFYSPHLRDTPLNIKAKHILVLGDSFTFGYLLPWEKTYVYLLQNDINHAFGSSQYQLLNAGTGGWGTADYLAFLEEYGEMTTPQIVLVFLNTDDIGRSIVRNIYHLADNHSLRLVPSFQPLPYRSLKTLESSKVVNWLLEHSMFLQILRSNPFTARHFGAAHGKSNATIPVSDFLTVNDEFSVRYGEALFHRINLWCKKHHAKLIVVTTGFNGYYLGNIQDPTRAFLKNAPAFFAAEGIPYYDTALLFKTKVKGKVFQIPGDMHPNEIGAKAIAEAVWPWLKKQLGHG